MSVVVFGNGGDAVWGSQVFKPAEWCDESGE